MKARCRMSEIGVSMAARGFGCGRYCSRALATGSRMNSDRDALIYGAAAKSSGPAATIAVGSDSSGAR